VAAFARASGLVASRVYWWRGRMEAGVRRDVEIVPKAAVFVPVVVRSATPARGASAAITVCLRDGHRVEVSAVDAESAAWVATFVRSLEEVPS
jgi:hypothetical protein